MSGEEPDAERTGRTPAERAGATPLDAHRLRAEGMPVVRRRRRLEGDDLTESASSATAVRSRRRFVRRSRRDLGEPAVIRRRRRRRAARRWLLAALLLTAVGVISGFLAWYTDPAVGAASGPQPDLLLRTPVLSARRAPELLVRPMAARNLREAVAPILAAAPPETCLEVRERGEPLVAHNETVPLVPASNLKLVVGAAALDLLDPGERLVTRFATDGKPTDGSVVQGNLYMVGGGDPLLTTDTYEALFRRGVPPLTDLEEVADRIASTGITEITGSVVGDGSRYDDIRTVDHWPERFLTDGQVAPLSALVVNDGWAVDPVLEGVGTGPTDDPEVHAADVMTALLRARGITVRGAPMAGQTPPEASTLVEVPSLTIAELVQQLLRFSDNTTTEMLVKELGLRFGGEGSTATGLLAITKWMADRGYDHAGVTLVDGSGLAEADRLPCSLLSTLLVEDGPTGPVAEGLAEPGGPGTLSDRFLAAPLRDSVRAKTGTLRSVAALSGWLRTQPGRDLAFALVINTPDRAIRNEELGLQRQLLEVMVEHPRTPPLEALSPIPPEPSS